MPVPKTFHVLGAIFLPGGVTTHVLLRPMARARIATGEGSSSLAAAAMTIQLVAWLLLVVVIFLMVAQPF